jgi:nitrous oxidase accessory protein NosD
MIWTALLFSLAQQSLPEVIVDRDDFVIDKSCRVRIAENMVIEDTNNNGVIHIRGDKLTVMFANGTVLRGAAPNLPQDQMKGIGVRVSGARELTLRGMRVQGFRCGIWASESNHLHLEGAFLSNNYAQRLRSTPQAEVTGDWLWPHANDDQEWRKNYGAGLYVERCTGVTINNVKVRNQQNGIVLDRVSRSRIFDNDCSFLSGWGLAMWRSVDNIISRNAFDFCIRGYSHGVYNRGQDSAGILLFEQCSRNVFAENSATHGGDGLFGFAGREALGDADVMPAGFSLKRAGCNDNFFYANDFSYAAAHGLELTFSFGNTMFQNLFVGNAICGIWGGFSQDTKIYGNQFKANGDRGYGLERGGINIDRSRNNWVVGNQFENNECGVHYWSLPTGFEQKPWGLANNLTAHHNYIFSNVFKGDQTAIHLRGKVQAAVWNNQFPGVGEVFYADASDQQVLLPSEHPKVDWPEKMPPVFGKSKPVGARAHLAGRENIIMGEWGPWDHQSPLVRAWQRTGTQHLYRLEPAGIVPQLLAVEPKGFPISLIEKEGRHFLKVDVPGNGYYRYRCQVKLGDTQAEVQDSFLATEWDLRFFATPQDPRENPESWSQAAQSDQAWKARTSELKLVYGGGGPKQVVAESAKGNGAAIQVEGDAPDELGGDHFGTWAKTQLNLPAGTWRITTLSDDGIRVLAQGKAVIDNWTWHAPTEDSGNFTLEQAGPVDIELHHFELNGYSVLELKLERVDE